jgi:hypothetical protein
MNSRKPDHKDGKQKPDREGGHMEVGTRNDER